jgi:hypothetical protein
MTRRLDRSVSPGGVEMCQDRASDRLSGEGCGPRPRRKAVPGEA